MRHNRQSFLATRLVACACATSFCLGPGVSQAQPDPETTVQMAMNEAEQGRYNGVIEKSLGRLGDAASVALTKLLADKPIEDADIPPILLVVKLSYDFPQNVEDAAQRKPRTTLYLLRSLTLGTKDPKIIASIANATAYVKGQYATYSKSHPDE